VQVCTAGDADARLRHAIGQGVRVGLLGPHPPLPAAAVWLRWTDDAEEQARTLYARLREADRHGLDALVAVLPEGGGIAAAVRDRLLRAAGLGDGKPDAVDAARD
jgi:L-threonylcarbamoyladenylate synthase